MEMMHRPVAVADIQRISSGQRLGQILLGRANGITQLMSLGQIASNGG